jgi:hypothetical protein
LGRVRATAPVRPADVLRRTTGEPEIEAIHQEVRAQATVALGVILGREVDGAGSAERVNHEMAAEIMRAGLAGLAIWWSEHPEVPRKQIVATALNVLWIGFERLRRGESWHPDHAPHTAIDRHPDD